MRNVLAIIDSFQVTEMLQPRLAGLELGTWFVIDGSNSVCPRSGSRVQIRKPSGESVYAHVGGAELRHGSLALRFTQPEITELPRFSTVSIHEQA